jgi:hypothetical protein
MLKVYHNNKTVNIAELPSIEQVPELSPFETYRYVVSWLIAYIYLIMLVSVARERISTPELNEQFSIIHEMSRLLSKMIADSDLADLLLNLLKGLNDSQLASTSGTCVVLNGLIKVRGAILQPSVPKLVSGLVAAMNGIANEQTLNGTLHAVRSLASHHLLLVVDNLLANTVPHSQ